MSIHKFGTTFFAFCCLLLWMPLLPMAEGRMAGDEIVNLKQEVKRDSLPSNRFIHLYGKLDNFFTRVRDDREATVAFLGGSITFGSGWRDHVMTYLKDTYPGTQWTFVNAGIPSLGSLPHAFRFEHDVLAKGRIDLLFIESAVNDLANGTAAVTQRRSLEGIVRHARTAQPEMDIILMAFADEEKVADYRRGHVPTEVQIHDEIAQHYRIPFINLAEEVFQRIEAKEFTWKDDFKDLHPSPFGHRLYFRTIRTLLQQCGESRTIGKLRSTRLPSPMDKHNYSMGKYVSVTKAVSTKGFKVNSSWTPADGVATRKGFVNVPILEADQAGSSFEFSFRGTAVGIAVVSGPDAGVIRYSVDGGQEQSRDLYTQWSNSLHLPWYLMLADGLKDSKHTLRVTLDEREGEGTKRSACRVVHLLVNGEW